MMASHQALLQSRRFIITLLCGIVLVLFYYMWLPFNPHSKSLSSGALGQPNNIIKDKVAAIIENRDLDQILPLILHFSTVLGRDWPIFLFTSKTIIPDSAPFKRLIDEHQLNVRFLPPDLDFTNRLDVSGFLTRAWLWEQLAPAKHVLIFQADSILCSNSPLRVDDFLKYDFIGAPIHENYGEGYNGGLSLRNRSMMLDIIQRDNWRDQYDNAEDKHQQSTEFEDQWFYAKIKELPSRGEPAASLPSKEVAMTFSVETIWYDTPLGYHQVARWQADKMKEVEKWCPENRLATSQLF